METGMRCCLVLGELKLYSLAMGADASPPPRGGPRTLPLFGEGAKREAYGFLMLHA